jgi:hypothetical protein
MACEAAIESHLYGARDAEAEAELNRLSSKPKVRKLVALAGTREMYFAMVDRIEESLGRNPEPRARRAALDPWTRDRAAARRL